MMWKPLKIDLFLPINVSCGGEWGCGGYLLAVFLRGLEMEAGAYYMHKREILQAAI